MTAAQVPGHRTFLLQVPSVFSSFAATANAYLNLQSRSSFYKPLVGFQSHLRFLDIFSSSPQLSWFNFCLPHQI